MEEIKKSEIRFWLDDYDDVFSDFDPRPYSRRAISDDFLKEASKVLRETKHGSFEIRLLIPKEKESKEKDTIVQKRLSAHFRSQAETDRKALNETRIKGSLICILGFSFMIIAAAINYYNLKSLIPIILVTILEPAGWFSIWTGFEGIFIKPQELRPAIQFSEKMSKASIVFEPY